MARQDPNDDVALFDLDPKFQEKLLVWLAKGNVAVDIEATEAGFKITFDPPSNAWGTAIVETQSIEDTLVSAMGSRSKKSHIDPEFEERVHAFLLAHRAHLTFSASHDDKNEFEVMLSNQEGTSARTTDVDFEFALVIVEDAFLGALPAHRLPPEQRAALERSLVSPAQREEEAEEQRERLRRALMEPRAELEANESYAASVRKYKFFVVVDGVLVSGWEYREDADDALADMSPAEGRGHAKIVAKSRLAPGQFDEYVRVALAPNTAGRRDLSGRLIGTGPDFEDWMLRLELIIPTRLARDVSGNRWQSLYTQGLTPEQAIATMRTEYEPNRQRVPYGEWVAEVAERLERRSLRFEDAQPAYWRHLYQAGFDDRDAAEEFEGTWLQERGYTGNGPRPPLPPPRPGARVRHPSALGHASRMVRSHDEKPFDPEAPRERYAKPHHFAVNAGTGRQCECEQENVACGHRAAGCQNEGQTNLKDIHGMRYCPKCWAQLVSSTPSGRDWRHPSLRANTTTRR